MSSDPLPDVLFSMNALRRAWKQVRRSGKSPGTDGVTPAQFEANLDIELNRLRQQILGGTYTPHPVRRFYIKKASGKERPISVWAIRDRVAQRVVVDYLTPIFEGFFMNCSYGFRPERGVTDAVEAVLRFRNMGMRWVLDADIQDCFGSISIAMLTGQVHKVVRMPLVRQLVQMWLYTPVQHPKGEPVGVSQGGVISPMLANLYLHRFDQMVMAALPTVKLVRFADDFVILARSEEEAVWSLDVSRRSLENLRLALNMRKTRIVHFDEGFQFLGVVFQGDTHQTPKPKK